MINPNDKEDFLDFMKYKEVGPPAALNNKILNYVKADLCSSHKVVFSKLLAIQAFIGFLTLAFCPQFNLSLTNNFELFHYFHHKFGENICMAICGSIFMGSGAIFATYILKSNEIKKIKESRFLYHTSISIFALSIFFLLGSDIYLKFAAYWLLGSILGSLITFEFNRLIRRKVFQY